ALRQNAMALVRSPRVEQRRRACGSRRREVPRLAHLSRGFGACVRSRLVVALSIAGRQAALRRALAAPVDARAHVRRSRIIFTRGCRLNGGAVVQFAMDGTV